VNLSKAQRKAVVIMVVSTHPPGSLTDFVANVDGDLASVASGLVRLSRMSDESHSLLRHNGKFPILKPQKNEFHGQHNVQELPLSSSNK
jgi:hypothetical protein